MYSTSHWDRLHIADNHNQSIVKFLQWHEISQATHNCTRFCKDIRNCEITLTWRQRLHVATVKCSHMSLQCPEILHKTQWYHDLMWLCKKEGNGCKCTNQPASPTLIFSMYSESALGCCREKWVCMSVASVSLLQSEIKGATSSVSQLDELTHIDTFSGLPTSFIHWLTLTHYKG